MVSTIRFYESQNSAWWCISSRICSLTPVPLACTIYDICSKRTVGRKKSSLCLAFSLRVDPSSLSIENLTIETEILSRLFSKVRRHLHLSQCALLLPSGPLLAATTAQHSRTMRLRRIPGCLRGVIDSRHDKGATHPISVESSVHENDPTKKLPLEVLR